jgi:UDP-glucuronate 4-epimerase
MMKFGPEIQQGKFPKIKLKKVKVLITGAAGFIGLHTSQKFINSGHEVVGLDNINDYYSTELKYARLNELGINQDKIKWFDLVKSSIHPNFHFVRMEIDDKHQVFKLFQEEKFDIVVNLAAQAGVRYSIENPDVYIASNIIGFQNILEACRNFPVKHLVHASSSSVYGENEKMPFSESDKTDAPISLYAATKKSNELTAHSYSHLFNIPITCLRFFTVYGPWGRPDMAPMLFVKAIMNNSPIKIFNNGEMERDFTFIDDIVEGIYISAINPKGKCQILNIGNGSPVNLMQFIKEMEKQMGKEAAKNFLPMQSGDVKATWADTNRIKELYNYQPKTNIELGVGRFIEWVKKNEGLI